MGRRWRQRSAIPGFAVTSAVTSGYTFIIILLPLVALLLRPWSAGIGGFVGNLTAPRVQAALRLSFATAALAAVIDAAFGLLIAWTLTRYRFPLRRLLDALIDLPLALPTAVAGVALSALYAPQGWLGSLGFTLSYTRGGILLALVFVGLPFVVRAIQPVLADLSLDPEEAAATLGATRLQTLLRIVLPALAPALLTGSSLAFARAVGEYGSVIFIAGNLPMVSEIAPLLIVIRLDEFDFAGASAIGVIMLLTSFLILWLLSVAHHRLLDRR